MELVTSNELREEAIALRLEVFVKEQGVDVSEEITGDDNLFRHFYLYEGDVLVSYARARVIDDYCLIGRVLTKKEYRKRGYSSKVLKKIEEEMLKEGIHTFKLHAQDASLSFYEKLGYHSIGEGYLEAGIPHHNAEKTIND